VTAVQVHGAGCLVARGLCSRTQVRNWLGVADDVRVVLVLVVTEVRCAGLLLVPAIRRHGRPAELERQKGEQDDGEEATHGQESSRPLKKWASNASGTLFSKKRVAQTRLRSDCTGQSGLFAGHLAHFGRTYPRAHA
jgi:hypothetical protein